MSTVLKTVPDLPYLASPSALALVPTWDNGVLHSSPVGALAGSGPVRNVTSYAIDSAKLVAGLEDPTAAFNAASAAAALVNGTVYIPKGTYGTGAFWEWTIPSGITVVGDGDTSVLYRCWLRVQGSAGAAIPFTGATVKGATSVPIPATGLTDSWIRVASVINCQSQDAGSDQLGTVTAEKSFFAEYARVLTGGASSATLDCRLVFPYSNTAGPDSGSFTTSIARVMTFSENVRVSRIKLRGVNTGHSEIIRIRFCRDVVLRDITIDSEDTLGVGIFADYNLDCKFINIRTVLKRTSVPANSSTNGITILSSQSCIVEDSLLRSGYQGVDISYIDGDATYRGGPSIGCSVVNSTGRDNARDGFTSHQGCYGSTFEDCHVFAVLGGIRIRSRGDRVLGCHVYATQAANFGILVDDAAVIDSVVANNYVEGGGEGILVTHSLTGLLPLETLLKCGSTIIKGNTVRGSADHGIYCNDAYTSAVMVGPRIEDNDIHFPTGDGIRVGSYNNGTIVRGNRISGIASGKSGIRYAANSKRLFVSDNFVTDVDASGFALSGGGGSTQLTDAITFPGLDTEAQLVLGPLYTDAATPSQSILRNGLGYLPPHAPGFGTSGSPMQVAPVFAGSGSPEGAVYGVAGNCLYINTATGKVYVRTSGTTGNTGWVVVGTQT